MLKLVLLLWSSTLVVAQEAQYGGPSILSRGSPASSINGPADISFRPYIGVNGTYYTGLGGPITDLTGHLQKVSAEGVQGYGGVYGRKTFRHTLVGLDYRGDAQHFPGHTFQDSIDQMLTLSISHQLSKRVTLHLEEIVGTYTRNSYFATGSGLIDPTLLNLPGNDLFDNRVVYGQASAGLRFRLTSRLSMDFTGSGFLVRRRSSALYGVTGYNVVGEAAYRVTKFVTLGAAYDFTHFEFTRAFGATDIHSPLAFVSARLSRSLEFSVGGGVSRVETLLLTTVPVDPVIAAITGQTAGIQAAYNLHYYPAARVRLTQQWQHANASLSYNQEVTPGNGVYLTSRGTTADLSLSYSGLRHWNIAGSFGYASMSAVAQSIGTYDSYGGGGGITRDLGRGLQAVFRADERKYLTNYAGFSRNAVSVSLGLAWSPGEVPLTLW